MNITPVKLSCQAGFLPSIAGKLLLDKQSLNDTPVLQVFRENLINIRLVQVGVPDCFRIDHDHGPLCTPIQAAGCIDAHTALTCQAQLLAALLSIIAQCSGTKALATITAIIALVDAEKNMVSVVRHTGTIP